jgi:hypothetical protein
MLLTEEVKRKIVRRGLQVASSSDLHNYVSHFRQYLRKENIMKKTIYFILIFVLLTGLLPNLWAQEKPKEEEWTGYLSDTLCGTTGYPEGYQGYIDLTVDPANHPVMCLTMDNCTLAGYGVFIKTKDNPKYQYFKFDPKGSELARKNILAKIKDQMAKTPKVTVKGVLKDGIITLSAITVVVEKDEKKPDSKKTDMKMKM